MVKLSHFTGIDIPIPELGLVLHQPSITELSYLGTDEIIFSVIKFITLKKENYFQNLPAFAEITNFKIFSTILQEKESKELKDNIFSLLFILFPDYKFMFSPSGGLIANNVETKHSVLIDDAKFEILQEKLREIFQTYKIFGAEKIYNPANRKAAEIAEKIKRGKQKVAAQKGSFQESVLARYISILSVGLHINPLEICKWTLPTLYEVFERFNLNMAWNIDLKIRLAGGSPDQPVDDWMKDIT